MSILSLFLTRHHALAAVFQRPAKVFPFHAAITFINRPPGPQEWCKGNIVKIDSPVGKPVATPNSESKVARNSTSHQAVMKSERRDEVQLTSSSQLQAMGSSLDDSTPMDGAKVEAIKQAISEGRFKINPEMIADRLLTSVKDLLASQKG
jgi:negative regulator of flagellin synthesis FlgM